MCLLAQTRSLRVCPLRCILVMSACSDMSPNPLDASQTAARLSKTTDMSPRHVSYAQYKLLRTSCSPRAAGMSLEHDNGTWDVLRASKPPLSAVIHAMHSQSHAECIPHTQPKLLRVGHQDGASPDPSSRHVCDASLSAMRHYDHCVPLACATVDPRMSGMASKAA